jgi:hypothetical protein
MLEKSIFHPLSSKILVARRQRACEKGIVTCHCNITAKWYIVAKMGWAKYNLLVKMIDWNSVNNQNVTSQTKAIYTQ